MSTNELATFDDDYDCGLLISWPNEANAIMNDVRTHVDDIQVSQVLPNNATCIYMNIRTKELNCYCIHVCNSGFRIVGNAYDTIDAKNELLEALEVDEEVFETPYALLDRISPSYVQSFGDELCEQLLQLQQMQVEFKEEDEEEEDEAAATNLKNASI